MQPVSLRVGEGEDGGWHPSLVLDSVEGREITLGVPTHRGYEVRVEPGATLSVQAVLPDGLRVFSATVLERVAEPGPGLRVTWPRSVQRVQRRDTVRVETTLPVEARVLDPGGEPRALAGSTIDVSEGGMRFSLAEAVEPEREMALRLGLPGGAVECAGRALRAGVDEAAPPERRHWAAVVFTELPAAARRELSRHISGVQHDRLRGEVA